MQTPKGRPAQSEALQKASPRAARQLRTSHADTPDSSSSSSSAKMSKERSPKVSERRSPMSPVADRRRVLKSSEMENQIIRLKEELKLAREEVTRTEVLKRRAFEDVEEMKKKMSEMEMSSLKELAVEEAEKSGDTYQRFSVDSSEIQSLKSQMKVRDDSEGDSKIACESANSDLESLRRKLVDTLLVIETMKIQLIESKQSESLAQTMLIDALSQLEDSRTSYNSVLSVLEKSKNSENVGIIVQEDEELLKSKAIVEELKADLMDKETELQGILEENEKLEANLSALRTKNSEVNCDLRQTLQLNDDLQTKIFKKDEELREIHDEIEILKKQMEKTEEEDSMRQIAAEAERERARGRERDAEVKLGLVMEEAERNSGKVARLTEQLEVAQAAGSEMETELRRMKVQSDQWRKAAEAAAAMLAAGNDKNVDGRLSPARRNSSPYNDDVDEDIRKRNGSVLKKIGVLWKKPHK